MASTPKKAPTFRIGFVPLLDAAPLIAASELGLFDRARLDVRIKHEAGWATIFDKMLGGEIDVAHALVGQALAMRAEAKAANRESDCPTPACFLNVGGAYIVLSKRWTDRGIVTARDLLLAVRSGSSERRLIFGTVHRLASHRFLLEQWLENGGAVADKEAQLVYLPPSLLGRSMQSGHVDGFCASEPWCTHSVVEGWGEIIASGEAIAPNYPDKVLLISARSHADAPEHCVRLLRCVLEAARWCDDPGHRSTLAEMLARRRYVDLPAALLRQALESKCTTLTTEKGKRIKFAGSAIRPGGSRLTWLAKQWRARGWIGVDALSDLFDTNLFGRATELDDEKDESGSCWR